MKKLYWLDEAVDKVLVAERPSLPNWADWDHGLKVWIDGELCHIAWAKMDIPVREVVHEGADLYVSDVLFTMKKGDRFEYTTGG